jgi:mono/diheme cytochrome c family protein
MRYAYLTLLFVVVATFSIFGLRGSITTKPPLEVFPDMDRQPKYKPQSESRFFADKRTDRVTPAGAVPYSRSSISAEAKFLAEDDHLYRGRAKDSSFARGFPAGVKLDAQLLEKGQIKFNIYCSPCHGALGDGNGITKQYGMGATPNFHDERIRQMAEGEIFNTITMGKNTMLSYADKIEPSDRWAVIAYVRALQRAQAGTAADVLPAHKSELGLK